jgi:hypothetical protein
MKAPKYLHRSRKQRPRVYSSRELVEPASAAGNQCDRRPIFGNTGIKHFHHPVVGELSLSLTRLDLPVDHGLTIFTYAAEPGSRSEEALKLLGSWAATADPAESVHTVERT